VRRWFHLSCSSFVVDSYNRWSEELPVDARVVYDSAYLYGRKDCRGVYGSAGETMLEKGNRSRSEEGRRHSFFVFFVVFVVHSSSIP